jgi:3-methyladenine DNA glycosylase/8-oxoguanine DNA glycosylase
VRALEAVVDPPHELDVALTVGRLCTGPRDPTVTVLPHEVWRAAWMSAGAATLRVRRRGAHLATSAWGPGAQEALDRAPALLGLADDPSTLISCDPVVQRAHRRREGLRLGATGAVVEALVPTILEQKVTSIEAHRSWRRLVERYGRPAPGPAPGSLRLPPHPGDLARLSYVAFHPLGIERRRADVIRRVCARAARLERLAQASPVEARRVLETFPGIGPWTSAVVTLRTHGDPDAVIVGDHNLPALVSHSIAGERHGDDRRMLELLEPYRGHRARVQVLLKLEGRAPPRRAPRARLREIAGM